MLEDSHRTDLLRPCFRDIGERLEKSRATLREREALCPTDNLIMGSID